MTNWERFWSRHPRTVGRRDYLRQVKWTVGGEPVPEEEVRNTIAEITGFLDLEPGHDLLDLCCGNGLVTQALAQRCGSVVGVDFSKPLIEVARADHQPANVTYLEFDVKRLDMLPLTPDRRFDRILMAAALQHFSASDLPVLLRTAVKRLRTGGVILFNDLPDRSRKWTFYNTAWRRIRHFVDVGLGRDPMGTWWDEMQIRAACRTLGLPCEILRSPAPTYRFHLRVRPMAMEP